MSDSAKSQPAALLEVKVTPNASRTEIVGWTEDGALRLRVQSPPQDGKANKAALAFLAKRLGVSKSRARIVRGESARQKTVAIDGLRPCDLDRLLGKTP